MFSRYLWLAGILSVIAPAVGQAEHSLVRTDVLSGLIQVAGGVPNVYVAPVRIPGLGSVGSINRKERVMVLNDVAYHIAPNVRVYLSKTRWGTLSEVHPGDVVRLGFSSRKDGSREVTEIRILTRAKHRGRDGA